MTDVQSDAVPVSEVTEEKTTSVTKTLEETSDAQTNGDEVTNGKEEKESEVATSENGVQEEKLKVESDPILLNKICEQIEYYFGNYNLPRDKFLSEEIKKNEGWVSMETMLNFKRLAALSKDASVIFNALKDSKLIQIDIDENRLRRSPSNPLPEIDEANMKEETIKRTVYCKGFPKDSNLDPLLEFFKQFGSYETVHMRYYFDVNKQKQGFKGSVLVVFPDVDKAEAFLSVPFVKYKGVPLVKKWHKEYLEEKKKEIEERKARKEARKKEMEEGGKELEGMEVERLPNGVFLHFSNCPAEASRESLREALEKLGESSGGECIKDNVAHVEYSRGEPQGYLRLIQPECNKVALEALQGKLKIGENELEFRLVEGEEEEKQLEKCREAKSKAYALQYTRKRKGGGGGGRGWGGRGRGKRRKTSA